MIYVLGYVVIALVFATAYEWDSNRKGFSWAGEVEEFKELTLFGLGWPLVLLILGGLLIGSLIVWVFGNIVKLVSKILGVR